MPRTCLDAADATELAEEGTTLAPLSQPLAVADSVPAQRHCLTDSLRLSNHQINGQHVGIGDWFESALGHFLTYIEPVDLASALTSPSPGCYVSLRHSWP